MVETLGQSGVLAYLPPALLEQQRQRQAEAKAAAMQPPQQPIPELASFIRTQFEIFRNHRDTASGWSTRMVDALRTYNGQYNPTKINEVRKFGGSEIYARISAQKCRAASSLLRDVYLGADRPWAIRPAADPDVPQEIVQKIMQHVQMEQQMVAQTLGQPPSPEDLQKRFRGLMESARDAAKQKAAEQAHNSEDQIEEILYDGGFYHALAEFLVNLPIFPFACIKGPSVKIVPRVVWPPGGGPPSIQQLPRMTWANVSPFDLWWTPGVSDIANANIIEKSRITRGEINDMLDLPSFNKAEVRAVLDEYGRGGLYDNWDTTDSERAVQESRENPAWNRSGMISMLEFNGNVQGRVLQEYGLPGVPDELRDYHIQAWVIGSHVIKANLSPSPRKRHPYYITSFEKVPGTVIGNGLIDLIADLQEASNATLRSLVNNMSIASGPQVIINNDRVIPEEHTEDLYPWKRWHTRSDPVGNNQKPPVEFFQPTDNSQSLMAVYKMFVDLSDDVSAIPKYVGGQASGGAGRTSSGLAMLMGNASKILQTVAANIDRDVFEPALMSLADLVMLTDTSGLLTGQEDITVQGVNVAIQRDTLRQRQLEFLQITNNPTDMQIVGLKGRGAVLRSISQTIGLDGEELVPPEEQLAQLQQQQNQNQSVQALNQHVEQGIQAGVKQGVQRISTELTAGLLASQAQLPEGAPVHIGTMPVGGGPGAPGASPGTPPGAPGAAPSTPVEQNAAQAQGNQPSQLSKSQTQHTNLNQQQPRPPMPQGGPG